MSFQEIFKKTVGQLESDLEDILRDEVSNTVDSIMSQQLYEQVYRYPASPQAEKQRRYDNGGLWDPDNIVSRVEPGLVLVVEDIAPFQDGKTHKDDLSDVVEFGIGGYRQPGPRPFVRETQKELAAGEAEKAVLDGLKARLYEVD